MKKIILVACLCLLCSQLALAQARQIRTEAAINLRSGYSLQSSIVHTVPSGTVLTVLGKFNRWLQVEWGGRQLWMADWVPFSEVPSGEPPVIDNYCFTIWTCESEADWKRGYYAYHNINPSGQQQQPSQRSGSGQQQPSQQSVPRQRAESSQQSVPRQPVAQTEADSRGDPPPDKSEETSGDKRIGSLKVVHLPFGFTMDQSEFVIYLVKRK